MCSVFLFTSIVRGGVRYECIFMCALSEVIVSKKERKGLESGRSNSTAFFAHAGYSSSFFNVDLFPCPFHHFPRKLCRISFKIHIFIALFICAMIAYKD